MKNKRIIIASVYRAYPKINAAFVFTQVIVSFGGTLPIIKSACSFANYVEGKITWQNGCQNTCYTKFSNFGHIKRHQTLET